MTLWDAKDIQLSSSWWWGKPVAQQFQTTAIPGLLRFNFQEQGVHFAQGPVSSFCFMNSGQISGDFPCPLWWPGNIKCLLNSKFIWEIETAPSLLFGQVYFPFLCPSSPICKIDMVDGISPQVPLPSTFRMSVMLVSLLAAYSFKSKKLGPLPFVRLFLKIQPP